MMKLKIVIFLACLLNAVIAWAESYEAPPWVPPPPPKSRIHLVDNGDGTLTETKTHLMWTQKDSFADLGKCLNWYQATEYVANLKTGGHSDWRLPMVFEYGMIYDNTIENNSCQNNLRMVRPIGIGQPNTMKMI